MAGDQVLDTVLLLALPASGKSEVRNYLTHLAPDVSAKDFHMGPTVQLDDYPYVHIMRRIDDELAALGAGRVYYQGPDRPFRNPLDWGTLVNLVNEDHEDLVAKKQHHVPSAAEYLLDRLDHASGKVGAPARMNALPAATRASLSAALEKEAREMIRALEKNYPDTLAGKTLVIEFARGGPDGAAMPLPSPLGYLYSVAQLSDALLKNASILYVWVTPEESRRKNTARAKPDEQGSILHHGVPMEVMMKDYGCDDVDWLESHAEKPGTVTIETRGKKLHLPIARFDNRVDKTSFLRDDAKTWKPDQVAAIHNGLKAALDKLARS